MAITMEMIKVLREKTGAGVMDAKKALTESDGDMKKAEAWIAKRGLDKAAKKSDRETAAGLVYSYIHHDGKRGALVKLLCETDFVAKTDDFEKLAKEIGMQATSMGCKSVESLLQQAYVRDPKQTLADLIKQTAAKVGENVKLAEVVRMEV